MIQSNWKWAPEIPVVCCGLLGIPLQKCLQFSLVPCMAHLCQQVMCFCAYLFLMLSYLPSLHYLPFPPSPPHSPPHLPVSFPLPAPPSSCWHAREARVALRRLLPPSTASGHCSAAAAGKGAAAGETAAGPAVRLLRCHISS